MSHQLLAGNGGTDCLVCGAHFHCSICEKQDEAREWSDHECEADLLANIVDCFKGDDCYGEEGLEAGSHHWTPGFEDRTAHCGFCGSTRGEGWVDRLHVGDCPDCEVEIWVNASQWFSEAKVPCPNSGWDFRLLFVPPPHEGWEDVIDWEFVKRHADAMGHPFRLG